MLKYLKSFLNISESYGAGAHIYTATVTLAPTSNTITNDGVWIRGDVWFDVYINGESVDTFKVSIQDTITIDRPLNVTTTVHTITGCTNNTHSQFNMQVYTYFTGAVDLSSSDGSTLVNYSYQEIVSRSETISPIAHGGSVGSSLNFQVAIQDYTITAYMTPGYFPGSCVGANDHVEIIVYSLDRSDMLATERYQINGGVSYTNGFSVMIPDNFNLSEVYVVVSGEVTHEELGDVTTLQGVWQGTLPYPQSEDVSVKVYTKESNYTEYGILYVKTEIDGVIQYVKAKSFSCLK